MKLFAGGVQKEKKVGCNPTYEELKPSSNVGIGVTSPCCNPTYEELKLKKRDIERIRKYSCNPTYEELKLIYTIHGKIGGGSCNPTYEELKWLTNYSIFKITPCYNTTYNIK